MKVRIAALVLPFLLLTAGPSYARKDVQTWKVADFMANSEYTSKLEGFKFSWGAAKPGKALGETESRRSTNGVNKSDEAACQWALLSALLALKTDAQARGGTAVVGLRSFATGEEFVSATEYQCLSGFTNSRVYIRGTIVK
jgi:hypothetical protein